MPRVSTIQLLRLPERPALVIRSDLPENNLEKFAYDSFHEIMEYLRERHEYPADIPYIRFFFEGISILQMEIGIQVAKPISGNNNNVMAATLPGGTFAFCMYQGPYDEAQREVYDEMGVWIERQGLKAISPIMKQYHNGLELPEDRYLTKISIEVTK